MKHVTKHHNDLAREYAAVYYARLSAGDASRSDREGLEDWLARNPGHRDVFSAIDEMSRELGDLEGEARQGVVQRDAPGLADMLEDAARCVARKSRLPAVKPGFLALAAGLLIAIAIPLIYTGGQEETIQPRFIEATPGKRITVDFEDGTRATLASNTRISVQIGKQERRVSVLSGEILLEVARDPSRPFHAVAGAHVVAVTGTVFSLRYRDRAARVTLHEGSLEVSREPYPPGSGPESEPWRMVTMRAGQQLELKDGARLKQLTPDELAASDSWVDGWLHFQDASLQDVVAEFEWHLGRRFVITSHRAARLDVGGSFYIDRLDSVIAALESVLPVDVTEQGEKIVIDYRDKGN